MASWFETARALRTMRAALPFPIVAGRYAQPRSTPRMVAGAFLLLSPFVDAGLDRLGAIRLSKDGLPQSASRGQRFRILVLYTRNV